MKKKYKKNTFANSDEIKHKGLEIPLYAEYA